MLVPPCTADHRAAVSRFVQSRGYPRSGFPHQLNNVVVVVAAVVVVVVAVVVAVVGCAVVGACFTDHSIAFGSSSIPGVPLPAVRCADTRPTAAAAAAAAGGGASPKRAAAAPSVLPHQGNENNQHKWVVGGFSAQRGPAA